MEAPGKDMMNMTDVNWVYSREEWRQFRLWKIRRAGWWSFLFHLLFRFDTGKVPEIRIMPGCVFIGNNKYDLGQNGKKLVRAQILEAGLQNVLNLSFGAGQESAEEVSILVPKGKLREAVAIEAFWNDTLLTDPPGWLRSVQQHPAH